MCWAVHTALPLEHLVTNETTAVEYTNALVEMALRDPGATVMSGIIEPHSLRELKNLLVDWKSDMGEDPRMISFYDPATALGGVSLYAGYPLAILFIANQSVEYRRLHRGESSKPPPPIH